MSAATWTETSARYAVVADTLRGVADALGPAPLRVLDAGGGHGRDAVALARAGHEVTVLDRLPSALAETRRAAALAGVGHRVRTVDADLDDLWALARMTRHRAGSTGSFDLVLCHDVLPERATLAQVVSDVAALTSSLRLGGALSLLAPSGLGRRPGLLDLDRGTVESALVAAGCLVRHRADEVASVLPGGDGLPGDPLAWYWHLVGLRTTT